MFLLRVIPAWFIFLTLITGVLFLSQKTAEAASNSVVISEVLVGNEDSASAEFVELHNLANSQIDMRGWRLVYTPSTNSSEKELAVFDSGMGAGQFMLLVSSSYIVPDGVTPDLLFAYNGGLAKGGGHIVLFDESGTEVDRLGWGNAIAPETKATDAPAIYKSMTRIDISTNTIEDTDDNSLDFILTDANPSGGGLVIIEDVSPPIPEYKEIWITELLPDPAPPQSDSLHEFVELYNPHDEAVNLSEYVLQSGSSYQYSYTLPNVLLDANSYMVLYASETGLTLANSSGQARLLSPTGEIVFESGTYSSIGEGNSWSLYEGVWQISTTATPLSKNKITTVVNTSSTSNAQRGLGPCPEGKFRNPSTNRCKTIEAGAGLKPCNSDQYRNPATNRCKKIESSVSGLQPCSSGQYRNPATNRCKSISSASATLKPCSADQYRNPETNRCKKIETSESTLKPCKEGQERNPETNRCRKVAGASTTNALTQPASVQNSNVRYGVVIAVAVLAGGYGLYEYRHEILMRIRKVFTSTS